MTGNSIDDAPLLHGYRPLRHIATAGFSSVVLYEQQSVGRQVAIKVLKHETLAGTQSKFADEARLMGTIDHDSIVDIYDAVVAPDGRLCLIMKYYPAPDFFRRVKQQPLSVVETLRVGVQLAGAVQTAHNVGVLHRDIKPGNVLSGDGGRPVLTDFGIAAAIDASVDSLRVFSPPWSPPESFEMQPMGVYTDTYALAATLYTLLTGRAPFEIPGGDNSVEAMGRRTIADPLPPTGRNDLPATFVRVLEWAMAKDPAHRPETVADFGLELGAIESELRLAPTPLVVHAGSGSAISSGDTVADGGSTGPQLQVQPTPGPQPQPGPSGGEAKPDRRKFVIGAVVAAAVLGFILVLGALGSGPDDTPVVDDTLLPEDGLDNRTEAAFAVPPDNLEVATDPGGVNVFTWTPVDGAIGYDVKTSATGAIERVTEPRFETTERCVLVQTVDRLGNISTEADLCA